MAEKRNADIENKEKKGGSSEPQAKNFSYAELQAENADNANAQVKNTGSPECPENSAGNPEPQAKNAGNAELQAENAGKAEPQTKNSSYAEPQAKNAGNARKGGLFQKEISAASFRRVLFVALFISGIAVLVAALCGFSLVVIDTSVGDRIFGDFWETARFSLAQNPYGEGYRSSYPPAAFLPVAPFALICKDALSLSMAEASQMPTFVLAVSLFYALNFALCGLLLCRLTKTKVFSPDGALRFLAVGASFPAVFMIARGNVIILSLLFLLLFLNFYESPSRALRVLACLFLGIAGAMKLYVLAFALLYVRRGRMQSALLTAGFFAAAFFLPFFLYGKGAIGEWWLHMSDFLGDTSGMAHANNVGILQLLIAPLSLVRLAGVEIPAWISKIYLLVQLLFAAVVTVLALFDRDDLRQFLLISLCCCQIANPSYAYILLMLLPAAFAAISREKVAFPLAAVLFFVLCPLCYIKVIGCYLQCFALSAATITLLVRSLNGVRKTAGKGALGRRFKALLYGFVDNGKRAETLPWGEE